LSCKWIFHQCVFLGDFQFDNDEILKKKIPEIDTALPIKEMRQCPKETAFGNKSPLNKQ